MTTQRLRTRHGASQSCDEAEAVAELHAQIAQDDASVILVFCSSAYDLTKLGDALRATFTAPVLACTSSGQIGARGFQLGGLVGASLASNELRVATHLISPISDCQAQAVALGQRIVAERGGAASTKAFALLLADGLSMMEERLAASLWHALGDIPVVGGSAGDDLAFERTHVYFDGAFVSGAAVVALFETTLPFAPFKLHHFEPTATKFVITRADPEQRIVYEIDGQPAAQAYADLIGVPVGTLSFDVFASHPMLLQIGKEHYVRTIQRVDADGSLHLLCAIDAGLVLSIGRTLDPMIALDDAFAAANGLTSGTEIVIGFDCICRRLELETRGIAARVGAFFAENRVIGFSTYGEQFNAIHVNQTFTGVALGA